jgi:hypothetical protein
VLEFEVGEVWLQDLRDEEKDVFTLRGDVVGVLVLPFLLL